MVKTVVEIIAVQNPVFTTFVAYASLLAIKMMCMSFFTAITRMRTKVKLIGLSLLSNPNKHEQFSKLSKMNKFSIIIGFRFKIFTIVHTKFHLNSRGGVLQ